MAFLKNKGIIFSIILALILVAGVFWIPKKQDDKKPADETGAISVSNKKQTDESWKSKFQETYALNPETDEISNEKARLRGQSESTLTEKIARDAFQDFVGQVNSGVNESAAQRNAASSIAYNLQNNTGALARLTDDFSEKDAEVSEDNSKEAIKNYINMVGRITSEEAEDTQGNELILLTKLIQEANALEKRDRFEEFESYVSGYADSASRIMDLSVPKDYLEYHLVLANKLNNLSKVNNSFIDFMVDPAKGLFVVKQYRDEAVKLVAAVRSINSRLSSDGISISPEDESYILFRSLQ